MEDNSVFYYKLAYAGEYNDVVVQYSNNPFQSPPMVLNLIAVQRVLSDTSFDTYLLFIISSNASFLANIPIYGMNSGC